MMIDPSTLTPRELYQLVISCVVPRPIALVTSVSAQGIVNAAPFSFFNAVSAHPPILMISVDKRRGVRKDTAANILHAKEFVTHLVDEAIAERMNITSATLPPSESEVTAAGFTLTPGVTVSVPRIVESAVQMECRLLHHVELGSGPSDIFFGEVVAFHIKESMWQDGMLDVRLLNAIGRMSGNLYCRTRDLFEMIRLR
jgi:flavin reductase (DIM6/NTAB) family NADH-FMN oxidoreductase RutF